MKNGLKAGAQPSSTPYYITTWLNIRFFSSFLSHSYVLDEINASKFLCREIIFFSHACILAFSSLRGKRMQIMPISFSCPIFIITLETYQAMLWYSSESIIFKNSKIALLEYFSTGTKIVGNHSKFYLSLMKTSGKHPVHF